MKDKLFETGDLSSVVCSEFEEAWRTDMSEIDGDRTYAVNRVGKALRDAGIPVKTIVDMRTLAAQNIREEIDAKKAGQ